MEGHSILLQLAIIYVFAKVGGFISKKLNQPTVLGEMLMGIIIGPSLLNLFEFNEILKVFSEIGVILLMFIAGLETNVKELKRSAKSFTSIALGGVFIPLIMCFGVAELFNVKSDLEAVYVGLIFSATSVSITVQTLREMKQLRSKQGIGILGAAIIDDIIGIILLALLMGFVTGDGSVGSTIFNIVIYFAAVLVVGTLIFKVINKLGYMINLSGSISVTAIIICFIFAFYAEKAEIAAITGAYLAGVVFSGTNHRPKISHNVEMAAYLIFTPIFFVGIGMSTEIRNINWYLIVFTIVLLFAAIIGKLIGSGFGSKFVGFKFKKSLQIGMGMVPRGEVALIIANLGLKAGILENDVFTVIVLVVILTALITPPLLKWTFKGENEVTDEYGDYEIDTTS